MGQENGKGNEAIALDKGTGQGHGTRVCGKGMGRVARAWGVWQVYGERAWKRAWESGMWQEYGEVAWDEGIKNENHGVWTCGKGMWQVHGTKAWEESMGKGHGTRVWDKSLGQGIGQGYGAGA